MQPDAAHYQSFYDTPLGQVVPELVVAQLDALWPVKPAGRLLGMGYALPYLDRLADWRVEPFAMMPARQGAVPWPDAGAGRTVLGEDTRLPFPDELWDAVILVHALEHANRPHRLLREVWRVLRPGGQVAVIIPNRRRMWSALEVTPFGYGRPYSRGQLMTLMDDHLLPTEAVRSALFMPPLVRPAGARLCRWMERPLIDMLPDMGGVLLLSARKEMAGTVGGHPATVPQQALSAEGQKAPHQKATHRQGDA